MHLIAQKIDDHIKVKNSIGGYPIVPRGYAWPICQQSQKKMVFFLQLDLPKSMGFGDDAHLSIFMSPAINEIPSFDYILDGKRLPDDYWIKRESHFKAYFFKGESDTLNDIDPYLEYQELKLGEGDPFEDIQLGGDPDWLQSPQFPLGSKGEKFEFILQIPENYRFPQRSDIPAQPDSFSNTDYCLFLGNQIYLFISKEIDDPEAVYIVVQN